MTTLCFDFGNSRLKYAVFNADVCTQVTYMANDELPTILAILEAHKPQHTILSSVIHHNTAIEPLLATHSKFHKLSATSALAYTIPVGKPETVGADRLALCAAATHYYPSQHNLIIALGSCITYNYINQYHEFLGGSISPGMRMRFKAMHEHTALLPMLDAENIYPLIGYDTKTNLLSGVLYGMAKEIDGIVAAYEAKFNNFNAILTGGDSSYFAPLLKSKIFVDNHFLFKGLYAISQSNNT